MRPFPPAETLQIFVGDALAEVRLNPFGLQFSFESERLIHVEHAIIHTEPDGTTWSYDCQADDRPPVILHRLLGRYIRSVEREDLRLTLQFENGSSLAILSDLNGYESGVIVTTEMGYVMF
ncbi:hypothetical protein [Sphingomonas sp. CCH5-D11]|uniref:hypothetical protein n=1 Tax=Sphingomonas sp. CCH5-D11 TaxID=1768786 RepID=UPI00082F03DF|nr:hypothetical protein [Sphingomonas sp. CCH5-D11]